MLRRARAKRLGLFWPTDGELGPPMWLGHRLRRCLPPGTVPYLPVARRSPALPTAAKAVPAAPTPVPSASVPATSAPPARMRFRRWGGRTRPGAWDIPEPPAGACLRPRQLDAVLVPSVAADAQGNRLGRGGGFYDRALQKRPGLRRPRLIGMIWDFQRVPSLRPQPWDVRLDEILTPPAKGRPAA